MKTMFPTLFPTWRRRGPTAEVEPFDSMFRDFFDEDLNLPETFRKAHFPRANVAETDREFRIAIELPGLEEKDVDIRVIGSQLVVKGERKQTKEEVDKETQYHRVESVFGAFERRFSLPDEVRKDPENIAAEFDKGMLYIHLPKVEPRASIKIPIRKGK
jgi:HSP20 family protein